MAPKFSGARLKEARLAAGLSRERVATEIERSFNSIYAYEHGGTVPPVDVLLRLAHLLGCSLEELCTEDPVGHSSEAER